MQPIVFLNLVSNQRPEKCGFKARKRRIHIQRFTLLGLDTIQISKKDFEKISVNSWWHFVAASSSLKKDITVF
jgi:hypothetical protein